MRINKVILASGSPRRKELLSKLGFEFEIITKDTNEDFCTDNPVEIVEELSMRKAKAVFDTLDYDDMLVIGADTIVYYDGEILGKPSDELEAKDMISMLSDRTHSVFTGVSFCIRKDGKELFKTFHSETKVTFYPIDKYDIESYIKSGSPLDKAGAYGIQDDFAKHVKKIEGDYNNVVGLPLSALYQELKTIF